MNGHDAHALPESDRDDANAGGGAHAKLLDSSVQTTSSNASQTRNQNQNQDQDKNQDQDQRAPIPHSVAVVDAESDPEDPEDLNADADLASMLARLAHAETLARGAEDRLDTLLAELDVLVGQLEDEVPAPGFMDGSGSEARSGTSEEGDATDTQQSD